MSTLSHAFTKTDTATSGWLIDDDVVRLRQWGTDIVHELPQPPSDGCTVGAAGTCAIRLHDPSRMVSRQHARLVRDRDRWLLVDLDSKNGLREEGVLRSEIALEPAAEIGIGGIALIAESRRSIELRGYLARMLGCGADRTAIVDQIGRAHV